MARINLQMNLNLEEEDKIAFLRNDLVDDFGIEVTKNQTVEWIVRQWFKDGSPYHEGENR